MTVGTLGGRGLPLSSQHQMHRCYGVSIQPSNVCRFRSAYFRLALTLCLDSTCSGSADMLPAGCQVSLMAELARMRFLVDGWCVADQVSSRYSRS